MPDATEYSPTHKEANRARELGLPRLLLVRGDVSDRDRDGKLNDWLRGLYAEVSGAQYATPVEAAALLEARLRETAAQQESLWVKLGPLAFPGQVAARRGARGAEFTVTARVRDGRVRRALRHLAAPLVRTRADRLTVGMESHPVRVDEVRTDVSRASESAVTIVCSQPADSAFGYGGGGYSGMAVTHVSPSGRSYGPAEQIELWAKTAVFGQTPPSSRRSGMDVEAMFAYHAGPTLPDVLRVQRAQGWMAEGLTRLFLVEHLAADRGATIERLSIGPATASGLNVDGRVALPEGGRAVEIAGVVPFG